MLETPGLLIPSPGIECAPTKLGQLDVAIAINRPTLLRTIDKHAQIAKHIPYHSSRYVQSHLRIAVSPDARKLHHKPSIKARVEDELGVNALRLFEHEYELATRTGSLLSPCGYRIRLVLFSPHSCAFSLHNASSPQLCEAC
jgi:hypothetical protein